MAFSLIHVFSSPFLQSKLFNIQESQCGYISCENFNLKCRSLLKPLPPRLLLPHTQALSALLPFPMHLLRLGAEQMAVP